MEDKQLSSVMLLRKAERSPSTKLGLSSQPKTEGTERWVPREETLLKMEIILDHQLMVPSFEKFRSGNKCAVKSAQVANTLAEIVS